MIDVFFHFIFFVSLIGSILKSTASNSFINFISLQCMLLVFQAPSFHDFNLFSFYVFTFFPQLFISLFFFLPIFICLLFSLIILLSKINCFIFFSSVVFFILSFLLSTSSQFFFIFPNCLVDCHLMSIFFSQFFFVLPFRLYLFFLNSHTFAYLSLKL